LLPSDNANKVSLMQPDVNQKEYQVEVPVLAYCGTSSCQIACLKADTRERQLLAADSTGRCNTLESA
jgi:hypothetical protein